MSEERLKYLFERHLAKTCTPAEKEELAALALEAGNDAVVKQLVSQSWEKTGTDEDMVEEKARQILEAILHGAPEETPFQKGKVHWIGWRRIAVAASIILIVGAGTYLAIVGVFSNKKKTEIVQTQQQRFKNDVQPGKNGAILILDNGQQIILDSAHNGTLAQQGSSKVIKKDDQLSYSSNQQPATSIVSYNTITTPRGRQYPNLILADGSKVWLDAASSIRFPTSFTGSERVVEITGQVWFDVAHNDKMPFKVIAKGIEINDLGTEFNISAYDDEAAKTTLIAGSVEVVVKDKRITIQPGQQAIFQNDNLTVAKNINVDEVMAWKTGYFQSDNATVESLMRQLSRWYDVDIVYEKPITKRVSLLGVPRTVTLVNILKIMETTGNVKFKIDGKTVTVMP